MGQKQDGRVVLRSVRALVLDNLLERDRLAVLSAAADLLEDDMDDLVREVWLPEGIAHGSFDAAVTEHAGEPGQEGNKPGVYRAVKKSAWFEKGPRNIEPPLA